MCVFWGFFKRLLTILVFTPSQLNFLVGSVGLLGMQTFCDACDLGIPCDGADPGGEAFYPVQYLRILLKDKWDPEATKGVRHW